MSKVKTVWSLEDVRKIVEGVERTTGERMNLELVYNGRLKRTLAQCVCRVERVASTKKITKVEPYKIEFGKTILNTEDKEVFKQIVLHEVAHAIANKRYQDNCGHDYRFKKVCEEIGCYETTKGTKREEIKSTYKYVVTCKCCGTNYNYHRKSGIVSVLMDKNSHYMPYRCATCDKDSFKLTQNY